MSTIIKTGASKDWARQFLTTSPCWVATTFPGARQHACLEARLPTAGQALEINGDSNVNTINQFCLQPDIKKKKDSVTSR